MVQAETVPTTESTTQTASPQVSSPQRVPTPTKPPRYRQRKANRRFGRYRGLVFEISAKIVVNGVITTLAILASNQLITNYQTNQSRLTELENEVQQTQARVNELNQAFTHHFAPYQRNILIQEKTNHIKPHQRRIIWLEPDHNSDQ